MSLERIDLVQNDTGPSMLLTLVDSKTQAPMDLSQNGTVLVMHFGEPYAPVKATIPLIPGPNAANGECMLDWPVGVLNAAGSYESEIQITWPTGRTQTTPQKLKFRVRQEMA